MLFKYPATVFLSSFYFFARNFYGAGQSLPAGRLGGTIAHGTKKTP
jgi:hypothetical protein